ncbi:MAG: hypothetical protein EZS28_046348, partial [Streblomastix strix]
AYVKYHTKELLSIPTLAVTVDTIHDCDQMALLIRDLNGLCKNDLKSAEMIQQAASNKCGVQIPLKTIPMGSTDAAAFTQAGIKSASLTAMDLSCPRWYHTRLDNADNLVPQAVQKSIEICYYTTLLFDEFGFSDISKDSK